MAQTPDSMPSLSPHSRRRRRKLGGIPLSLGPSASQGFFNSRRDQSRCMEKAQEASLEAPGISETLHQPPFSTSGRCRGQTEGLTTMLKQDLTELSPRVWDLRPHPPHAPCEQEAWASHTSAP